ncbi:type I restriction enzyme, S subunit [Salegentibacter holothuriorum]|uniref:Type I restriction enzyme, S subunit n=1 Tax=Salegentibacter holothuriorum TaxID=241145 RepID=A0A1T5DZ85_9FLAO|nr:restriction endonuclease subunit S [Salegentibacter holothuriorum]SKB76965.1 type I restriction enzyme, S subunit [Salegentibacter holothuriorum]
MTEEIQIGDRKSIEHKAVPKLRFKEFEGIYSEKMLKKVFSIFNGYAFSSTDSQVSGVRWIKIADVGINEMKKDSPSFLPSNYLQKYNKFIILKGDIVVALTRPIIYKQLKIARIDDLFNNSLLNQRVGKLVSHNHLLYIYYTLQRQSLISKIENRIAGTDPPNLSPAVIGSLKTYIPSIQEQQKIASFLSAVDKKIQQLSRKKELLETYKKGVMQQLFSQEIRFKDKSGKNFAEWEEKKYGEVYTFYSTNSFSRDQLNYEKGEVKNIHYGDIHTKLPTLLDLQKENIPYVNSEIDISKIKAENYCQEGDLIIADASEDHKDIGKAIELIELNNEKVLAGLHTFIARPVKGVISKGFSGYLMQSWKLRKQVMTIAQGTKVLGLSATRMKKLKLEIPSLEEQQKIANFLSAIDKKIEAVSQQIEKTKSFKKGLLQQMFV